MVAGSEASKTVTPAQPTAPAQFTTALPEDEIPKVVGGCTLAGLRAPPSPHVAYHTQYYGNLIKKPWVFIRFPYMNPNSLGLQGQGFFIRFLQHRNPHI